MKVLKVSKARLYYLRGKKVFPAKGAGAICEPFAKLKVGRAFCKCPSWDEEFEDPRRTLAFLCAGF